MYEKMTIIHYVTGEGEDGHYILNEDHVEYEESLEKIVKTLKRLNFSFKIQKGVEGVEG